MTGSTNAANSAGGANFRAVELAKALSNVSSKADDLIAATESFKTSSKDALVKLNLDIESKRLEVQDFPKQIDHTVKNGKIDVDTALRKYKRDAT